MSEEEAGDKAQSFMNSFNRFLDIGAGIAITVSVIYVLSMTESPLHPTNNLQFGLFVLALGAVGLYWLVTGIKPGLKISELRS